MASIRKRGTNSYLLTVELGYDAQGKRVIKDNPMNGVKNLKKKQLEKSKCMMNMRFSS
ncbi:hypothetical protein ABNF65_09130 [Paenibacillus larvae]